MLAFPKPATKRKPAVIVFPDGREVCGSCNGGRAEYMARKMQMAIRQKWLCALCGFHMDREDVTFDHEFGRGMGGSRRDDRIEIQRYWHNAAVHGWCNVAKGSRVMAYVITQESVA